MQAKIELALSHNDSIGTNNELKLAELMTIYNVPLELYSDDNQEINPNDLLDEDSHECPKCGFEFNCDKKEA